MFTLLKISAEASVLVVLVLLAQWIFGRQLAPRWRYALWLLVIARLALPATIPSRLSVFNLADRSRPGAQIIMAPAFSPTPESSSNEPTPAAPAPSSVSTRKWLFWIWAAGALAVAGSAVLQHVAIHRRVAWRRPLLDGQILGLLEDTKEKMGVNAPVMLIETNAVRSPALFGFIRPRLLLPPGLLQQFSREELRHMFLHEVAHIKRHDIFVGWLALLLQIAHWFNPFVWAAFYRMRVDRELACDALALSCAGETAAYGFTMVKLLESFASPVVAPALAGILENKQRMKERIHMIATYRKSQRGPALALGLFALFALTTLTDCQTATPPRSSFTNKLRHIPAIISTTPAAGASDVDPFLPQILVTFDCDMAGGMSWTGGGPDFPPLASDAKAHWIDKRTCALPVKLEAAHYYRVGINSTSYRNFRAADGTPAIPSAIYFTTVGAPPEVMQRLITPYIVSMSPPNDATDVNPKTRELRVTFSMPMGGGGSWCGGGPEFPTISPGKRFRWSTDHRTCILPVELEPNSHYEMGINCESHRNFTSQSGVPLEPVTYSFSTRSQ